MRTKQKLHRNKMLPQPIEKPVGQQQGRAPTCRLALVLHTGGVGCNWSEVCVWQPCSGWDAAGSYVHPLAINTQATNASEALLRLGEPTEIDEREGKKKKKPSEKA